MRGTFNEFATDNISIVKKNGQKFEGFKASVQKGKSFFGILRFLSNLKT